eukprot:174284_1
MSISDAAEHFHNGNYAEAAEILKKNLYNASPNTQHNYAIAEFYSKPNPRSQSKTLLKQLTNLRSSYPSEISSRAALLFNEAELYLNRHQYSKSVEIFKSLINSVEDNVPVNIYFRSCLRLFSVYLHHEMIDYAKLIHSKLTNMREEDINALDKCNDTSVSSLKHSYWCHIIGCHLKLIESQTIASSKSSGKLLSHTPVQAAYKELTKAIDLIKKNKSESNNKWDVMYKIRILFLKAHQDFISGNVNTAKSQLFQTHIGNKTDMNSEQSILFLNNMSCIYGIADETGSAMSLIHRALTLHALYMDKSPLYSSDYMISYLCYNAGLYLQNLSEYHRSIDSFLCCLPVLQSKPRLWLRMAQCVLSIWEPYGNQFISNKDGQPQLNSLVQNIIYSKSTKRGDLYLLPIGKKCLIYNNIPENDKEKQNEINHILKWHERNDNNYSFPYKLYKKKQQKQQQSMVKRWGKRKQKQKEFCKRTNAIINQIENNNNNNNNNKKEKEERKLDDNNIKKEREKRLYEKEKLQTETGEKENISEYKLQIRELTDLKLAVEWLKNSINLFKKMETNLFVFDYIGHISSHLHLSYCYLKLKAWNFAFRHAEQTINIYKKEQTSKVNKYGHESHNNNTKNKQYNYTIYLAHMYAAEALIHLNKFNTAESHLNHLKEKYQTNINNINNNNENNNNENNSNNSNDKKK